jgi:hypothetical protein
MPRPMLYGSRLRGYTPYACRLQSGPTKWIIWWITHKRKSTNLLSYITHYTCLQCRYLVTLGVCPTPVVCLTPVVYPNSSRTCWLWSTSQLRSYLLTPVTHHGFGQWVCYMSYHLSQERLCMVGLDDYSILQLVHLVGSRLGGTHDSISVQNLSISQLRTHE